MSSSASRKANRAPLRAGATASQPNGDESNAIPVKPSTFPFNSTNDPIYFYDRHKEYYAFSNFSDYPVRYNMKDYPTSEHLFQSLKFEDPRDSEAIRSQSSPRSALAEARRLRHKVRKDWISGRVNIKMMEKTILLKFTQHEDLKDLLLSTLDAHLIEDSPNDSFWGIGSDRKGQNQLGEVLMRVRATLRAFYAGSGWFTPGHLGTT